MSRRSHEEFFASWRAEIDGGFWNLSHERCQKNKEAAPSAGSGEQLLRGSLQHPHEDTEDSQGHDNGDPSVRNGHDIDEIHFISFSIL